MLLVSVSAGAGYNRDLGLFNQTTLGPGEIVMLCAIEEKYSRFKQFEKEGRL